MPPRLRDVISYAVGVAGIVHQIFIADSAQTIVVFGCIGLMVGTPVLAPMLRRYLGDDSGRRNGNGKPDA